MAKSRKQKKYERHLGVNKYNKILSVLVADKKKRGEKYVFRDLQKQASSLYPNFKDQPYKAITKTKIRTSQPQPLTPGQRRYSISVQVAPTKLLPEELTTPNHYWYLREYDTYIISLPKDPQIRFISKISPSTSKPFNSGDNITYEEYFSSFVNYCNKLKALDEDEDAYNNEWFVVCSTPEKQKDGSYISYIISGTPDVDGKFIETDYGFDPDNPELEPGEWESRELKKPTKEKPEPTPEKPVSDKDIRQKELEIRETELRLKEKELENERLKETRRIEVAQAYNKALDMLSKGDISHDDFDRIIGGLYN